MQAINWKHGLALGGFLLYLLPATAQHSRKVDVLYFRNGSIIRGKVLSDSAGAVRLENRVKDTLVFPAADIERMVQEPAPVKVSRQGFYSINEAGIQFSGGKGLVLRCIAGYRFAYQWQAGAGIGLDDYRIRSAPVFADVRYDFSRDNHTYFIYGGGGVSLPWPTDRQLIGNKQPDKKVPGPYIHAGLGHKFRLPHNHAFLLSAGYSYAAMKTKYAILDWMTGEPLGTYTTYNYSFNRVTITIGFSF